MLNIKIKLFSKDNFLTSFIILCLTLSVFINYFHYDEAWYFYIVQSYDGENFYNFDQNKTYIQNFYKYLLYIFSSDLTFIENYYSLRFISFFSIICSFFLIRKIYFQYLIINKRYFFFGYIFLLFWFCFNPGGISARPDALVSLFNVLLIFIVLRNSKLISYFLIICLLCVSIHPNFAPIIMTGIYFLIKENTLFYKDKNNLIFLLIGLIISYLLLIFAIKDFTNIKELINIYQERFNHYTETSYSAEALNNYFKKVLNDLFLQTRLFHLKLFYPKLSFFLTFIFLITAWFLIINSNKNNNKVIKSTLVLFVFTYIFFVLSPTKWSHHLSSIVILIIIITPPLINRIVNKILKKNFFLKSIIMIKIFLIFLLINNFYIHSKNNYFLYKFLKKNEILNQLTLFNNLKILDKKFLILSNKFLDSSFYSDPEFALIFNQFNYLGNDFKKISLSPDILILHENSNFIKNFFEKKFFIKYKLVNYFFYEEKKYNFFISN